MKSSPAGGVIPLNSPAYYAPYNGAIEQGIKELKKEMARALPVPESWNVAQVGPFVAVAAAQRNYQPPSLPRRIKCQGHL